MPKLFVPPSKSVVTAEIAVSETVIPWQSEALGEEPFADQVDGQAPPALLTTVDTFFFYDRAESGDPVLYQVNVAEGSLVLVSKPPGLFPTALNGLLAAEPTIAPWLEPEFLESEALEPDTLEPEALESKALKPNVLEPEALSTDSPGLESIGADSPEADTLAMPPAATETSVFTLVQGTNGKNFLIGSTADNALFGFGGDDLILTAGGNNLAFGGAGNDTIIGGPGDDILFGGLGDDVLEGGAGNDHLFGGDGDDILYGGAGANVLVGGAGADIFRLGTPGAYGGVLVGATEVDVMPDTIVDFSIAEGDRLDLSLIAAQPAFAGVELLPFLSFVQVGANTEVQVATPLGQTTTEAILLDVEADTITPSSLSFTTPAGLPLLK